jgi:hypothetical protein
MLVAANFAGAEETTFQHVKVPDLKGRQVKAELIFSDLDKSIEVRPDKGDPVNIPYGQIDKCTYEFTQRRRVTTGTIVLLVVAPPVGLILMVTKARSHWLQIDYRQKDEPKFLLLRMDKEDYVHILEAVKNHTGNDAEILGNANKRSD